MCYERWQPKGLTEGLLPILCATRPNPLAKDDCNIANGLRHCRHTGPAAFRRQPDALASGENEKIGGGKMHFPNRYFYHFHCARGYIPFILLMLRAVTGMEDEKTSIRRDGSRSNAPGAGGMGAAQALLYRTLRQLSLEIFWPLAVSSTM